MRFISKLRTSAANELTATAERNWLIAIIALGAVCRIGISFFTGLPNLNPDSYVYYRQAAAIMKGGYINFYPNGYPFLIVLIKKCLGTDSVAMLLWVNIVLSSCTVYFTYGIAKKLFQTAGIALLAAFIIAVFPSQLNYVRWLMTEVPATFFLVGSYYFYYRKKYWATGLFLGVATLLRTEILTIFLALLVLDLIYRKRLNIALLTAAILPMIWLGSYCYIKTGEFSLAGHNRFNTIVAVSASGGNIDFQYPDKHPEVNTTQKAVKMYLDYCKNRPVAFLKSRLANLWELWGVYNGAIEGGPGIVGRIIAGLGNLFLLFFGLPAWWRNRKDYRVFILIIPFVLVTLVHVIYFAVHRYGCPVEPFLAVLSAWNLSRILSNLFNNRVSESAVLQ